MALIVLIGDKHKEGKCCRKRELRAEKTSGRRHPDNIGKSRGCLPGPRDARDLYSSLRAAMLQGAWRFRIVATGRKDSNARISTLRRPFEGLQQPKQLVIDSSIIL